MSIQTVGMIGRGALGILFAHQIEKVLDQNHLCFIADEQRVDRYQQQELFSNDEKCEFHYVSQVKDFQPVDLILMCVKFNGLNSAIETIKDFIKEDTIIISVLNGISSENILQKHFPNNIIVRCIAQGMDAVYCDHQLTYSHFGELVIGATNNQEEEAIKELSQFFDKTHIPYTISKDIIHSQWNKLMLNCGVNQVCAAYNIPYGGIQDNQKYRNILKETMKEVQKVAAQLEIIITDDEIEEWFHIMDTFDYEGMPSMRQDVLAHRKTELGLFSGTVIPIAHQYGIEVPHLEELYHLIQDIEKDF